MASSSRRLLLLLLLFTVHSVGVSAPPHLHPLALSPQQASEHFTQTIFVRKDDWGPHHTGITVVVDDVKVASASSSSSRRERRLYTVSPGRTERQLQGIVRCDLDAPPAQIAIRGSTSSSSSSSLDRCRLQLCRPSEAELFMPPYLRAMLAALELGSSALDAAAGRGLVVGLGAGSMPLYLWQKRPSIQLEVAETIGLLSVVTRECFGLRHVLDHMFLAHKGGREFLVARPPFQYSFVFIDVLQSLPLRRRAVGAAAVAAAAGATAVAAVAPKPPRRPPPCLLTKEFLEAAKMRLIPSGGVLVMNLGTAASPKNNSTGEHLGAARILRTFFAVFKHVLVSSGSSGGNSKANAAGHDGVGLGASHVVVAAADDALDPGAVASKASLFAPPEWLTEAAFEPIADAVLEQHEGSSPLLHDAHECPDYAL